MQSLKKFSPESIRAIARKPKYRLTINRNLFKNQIFNITLETQQFQELLTQMDTIQRQSIDQNLRKLAETAGLPISTRKTIADILKTLKIIYI